MNGVPYRTPFDSPTRPWLNFCVSFYNTIGLSPLGERVGCYGTPVISAESPPYSLCVLQACLLADVIRPVHSRPSSRSPCRHFPIQQFSLKVVTSDHVAEKFQCSCLDALEQTLPVIHSSEYFCICNFVRPLDTQHSSVTPHFKGI